MRFVPTSCLKEGMILGKSLYNNTQSLMLNKGCVLKNVYINKINELELSGVYIDDEFSKDVKIKEVISEELKHKTIKRIKNLFIDTENNTSGKSNQLKREENIKNSLHLVEEMIENILENKNLMINMIDMKIFDDYTYYHSVNVATLSLVVGAAMNLNKNELYELGLGALLHDIGKVFIPKNILNKPSKLTDEEFEIMKTHSEKGYKYLKQYYMIPLKSYVGALQHHEKYDGTGYPDKKEGDKISLFGRIIAIADVYDALTSNRPYRKSLLPSEAIEYIMGNNGIMFDPKLVKIFTKKVAPYPIGLTVVLSNGEKALVMENFEECTTRPIVKLLNSSEIINLKEDKRYLNVTIIGMVEID